jgi:hypothetical protein
VGIGSGNVGIGSGYGRIFPGGEEKVEQQYYGKSLLQLGENHFLYHLSQH